jgi:hypothetical protein
MKSNHFLLPAIFFCVCNMACTKSTTQPGQDDFIPLIESGDWKITVVSVSPALFGTTDFLGTLPSCEKDNLFQFRGAGAFYHDEGLTKCDPAAPQNDTGTWRYDPSDKILRFSSPVAQTKTLIIQKTTQDSIAGIDPETINGVVYTFSVKFTKQ